MQPLQPASLIDMLQILIESNRWSAAQRNAPPYIGGSYFTVVSIYYARTKGGGALKKFS